MIQLKKISAASIPDALEKAERYRFLNEPRLAESICQDILEVDAKNHPAIVTMLLAITDQFDTSAGGDLGQARQLIQMLEESYDQYYYSGIVCERQGKAILGKNIPGSSFIAYEWFYDAMEYYEKAEAIRPAGNDDSILRWNTCARLIMRHHLKPRDEKHVELPLE
jgi:hypothetical protein